MTAEIVPITPETVAELLAPTAKETERVLERKWGHRIMGLGFTVIPSVILRAQPRLHINAIQLAVLMHLLDYWWQPEEMPWPGKKVLAARLGVSIKTIQRALVHLENEKLIQRTARYRQHGGRTSNSYDLAPLVEKLRPIAEEIEAANKEAEKLKSAAIRPGLRRRKPAS